MFTQSLQHITYGSPGSSSNVIKGDAERNFFVELWDVSGHDRYRDCRSLFYSQINGTPFSLPTYYYVLFFLNNQFGYLHGMIFITNR
jgi:hypothetical protein